MSRDRRGSEGEGGRHLSSPAPPRPDEPDHRQTGVSDGIGAGGSYLGPALRRQPINGSGSLINLGRHLEWITIEPGTHSSPELDRKTISSPLLHRMERLPDLEQHTIRGRLARPYWHRRVLAEKLRSLSVPRQAVQAPQTPATVLDIEFLERERLAFPNPTLLSGQAFGERSAHRLEKSS